MNIYWAIKRLICIVMGCDVHYWAENEYINGSDCRRCDAYKDSIWNESPFPIIEKEESLIAFFYRMKREKNEKQ